MKKGPSPARRFRAASFSRCCCTSISDLPFAIPYFGPKASFGIARSRSSTLFAPMRASIALRSASVCGEYGFFPKPLVPARPRCLADVSLVVIGGEELLQLPLVRELHLQHPTVLVRHRRHQLLPLPYPDVG